MLRLTNIANQYKKRTLRALYAQTQAYPYGMTLDTTYQTGGSNLTAGLLTATTPAVTTPKAAVYPGLAMYRKYDATQGGENVLVLNDTNIGAGNELKVRSIGLCANFIGGELDELYGESMVGVWRGRGGVFEVLAPAFEDAHETDGTTATNALSVMAPLDTGLGAAEVYLGANPNGQLAAAPLSPGPEGTSATKSSVANRAVARLISRLSATAIVIELLV